MTDVLIPSYYAAPLRMQPHIRLRPNVQPGSLGAIVRSYKSAVTKAIRDAFGGRESVWQRNYYEHVIRDAEEWDRIHLYIEANPASWLQDRGNPAPAADP